MSTSPPDYLAPYLAAAKVHGGGFPSLLWASASTQAVRFDAFTRLIDFRGASVLDVGCGRADFRDFLLARGLIPAEYLGIEAVPDLADAAQRSGARVLRADFIASPRILFTGSDLVVISGSLNTAKDIAFYDTIRRAYDAAARALVFNFLSSPQLAAATHLYWRDPSTVLSYCKRLCAGARMLADYLPGDATLLLPKPSSQPP